MTSTTDKLRQILDERGVEWSTTKGCDSDSITTVHVDGRFGGTEWEAFELADGTFQVTAGIYDELSPEQFIAATLGSVTCSIVKTWSDSDYVDDWRYRCSECGCNIPVNERDPETGDVISAANYCPNCGARVVGE